MEAQPAEWPKAPTSGVLLLSTGPLRSERCCFLGCSKPLHICRKREKGFKILLSSEKLKNKGDFKSMLQGQSENFHQKMLFQLKRII